MNETIEKCLAIVNLCKVLQSIFEKCQYFLNFPEFLPFPAVPGQMRPLVFFLCLPPVFSSPPVFEIFPHLFLPRHACIPKWFRCGSAERNRAHRGSTVKSRAPSPPKKNRGGGWPYCRHARITVHRSPRALKKWSRERSWRKKEKKRRRDFNPSAYRAFISRFGASAVSFRDCSLFFVVLAVIDLCRFTKSSVRFCALF